MKINEINTKQLEDKRQKEKEIREDQNKQAAMWAKERDLWKEEEERIQAKIKKINQDTVEFLKK